MSPHNVASLAAMKWGLNMADMNHEHRKELMLQSIQSTSVEIARAATSLLVGVGCEPSLQKVLDGIESLKRMGFNLQTEMKSHAIQQEMKAREVNV